MKRIWLGIGAALVVLAFIGGFWPQHRQLTAAQELVATQQTRLDTAEARVRLGQVLGQLLRFSDAVRLRNYGTAATWSSAYFDSALEETSRANAEAAAVLNTILKSRDQVTTAIASMDAGLELTLREHERQLRRALGYPTGAPE